MTSREERQEQRRLAAERDAAIYAATAGEPDELDGIADVQRFSIELPAGMARSLKVAAEAHRTTPEAYAVMHLMRALEAEGLPVMTFTEAELDRGEVREALESLPEPPDEPFTNDNMYVAFPVTTTIAVYEKMRIAAGGDFKRVREVAADIISYGVDGHVRWMWGNPGGDPGE